MGGALVVLGGCPEKGDTGDSSAPASASAESGSSTEGNAVLPVTVSSKNGTATLDTWVLSDTEDGPLGLTLLPGDVSGFPGNESIQAVCRSVVRMRDADLFPRAENTYTDVVSVQGCGSRAEEIGEPSLPCESFRFEIPHGVGISVAFDELDTVSLGTGFLVCPMQPEESDGEAAQPQVVKETAEGIEFAWTEPPAFPLYFQYRIRPLSQDAAPRGTIMRNVLWRGTGEEGCLDAEAI